MEKFITGKCEACKGTGKQTKANPTWLRLRRFGAEISLRKFSQQLGLSASYISDVELGRRQPSPEVFKAYEKLMTKERK